MLVVLLYYFTFEELFGMTMPPLVVVLDLRNTSKLLCCDHATEKWL